MTVFVETYKKRRYTGRTTRLVYKYTNGQLETFIRQQLEQTNKKTERKTSNVSTSHIHR